MPFVDCPRMDQGEGRDVGTGKGGEKSSLLRDKTPEPPLDQQKRGPTGSKIGAQHERGGCSGGLCRGGGVGNRVGDRRDHKVGPRGSLHDATDAADQRLDALDPVGGGGPRLQLEGQPAAQGGCTTEGGEKREKWSFHVWVHLNDLECLRISLG